jgi:hypothetical protein
MKPNQNQIGTGFVYIHNKLYKTMKNFFENIYGRDSLLITSKQLSISFNSSDYFRIKENSKYSIACRARNLYTKSNQVKDAILINLNF